VSTELNESEDKFDPSKMQFKIATASGVWTVRKPMGRIGAMHFAILSKSMPTSSSKDEDGNVEISPADIERQSQGFLEWTATVLPKIIIDGPCKYDQMAGEDQYGLYFAMLEVVNVGEKLFRFVE